MRWWLAGLAILLACEEGTTTLDGGPIDGGDAPGARDASEPEDAAGAGDSGTQDPCLDVDCDSIPLPMGVAELDPVAAGDECSCLVAACLPGFVLIGGACLYDEGCEPGYRQEGNRCVVDEGVSCYLAPYVELCVPTRCSEQPLSIDGVDLEALGKCVDDPAPPPESCTSGCHDGIEEAHVWWGGPDLTCTGCHGGNPTATTREAAHVPLPAEWSLGSSIAGRPNLRYYWNYLTLSGVERFGGGLEWLRFRNPTDLRIADQTCGRSSGCHRERVENVRRSLMATSAGVIGAGLARSGVGRNIVRGADGIYKWDTTEGMLADSQLDAVRHDPSIVGSVQRIVKFESRNRIGSYSQVDLLSDIYDKACGHCHLGSAGSNARYGEFRASGCAACHMVYTNEGRSSSDDPAIPKTEPSYPAAFVQIANFDPNDLSNAGGAWIGPERPHPRVHRLVESMASVRCGTCHSGSNRTDWQFRGIQIDPNRTGVAALSGGFIGASQIQLASEIDNEQNAFARIRGLAQEQLLSFIDWDNDGNDDTPADVHWQAGLECVDCHGSSEMHNELRFVHVAQVTDWNDPAQVTDMSGALWSRMDQATEVECVHCHGNLEHRALPHAADNRNPIRALIACAEVGEQIPNYQAPPECALLGRGRWLFSRFSGRWHFVAQTFDTVRDVQNGATAPNGSAIYTLNASIFHGRVDGDPNNGVGPCAGGSEAACFRDQATSTLPIATGFSHLGGAAVSAVDQMRGGLECYACHSTWANMCFGCHLRLSDTDGASELYAFAPSTGERTLGAVTAADATLISATDMQYGINGEGKIGQLLPESKQHVAHTDVEGREYFGTSILVNGDASIEYNVYRDRAGYGLRQYVTELVGLPLDADGITYDQDPRMDANAGQGAQPMMPHSVQRSHPRMDCTHCHRDLNDSNEGAIAARFMFNPNGFSNLSAYLSVMQNISLVRAQSSDPYFADGAAGFRFDANTDPFAYVVDQQADYCVDRFTGFPFCYDNHPIREGTPGLAFDPAYARSYPGSQTVDAHIAGPLDVSLLTKIADQIRVRNEGVSLRGPR